MVQLSALKNFCVFPFALCFGGQIFARQQTFDGLRVSLIQIKVIDGGVTVDLRLQNVSNESGRPREIAVAAFEPPGVQMYTPPIIRATISDGSGGWWERPTVLGLGFGNNEQEWLNLRPGGSVPISVQFQGGGRDGFAHPPWTFGMELKLYRFDGMAHQRVPVLFGPIGVAPRRLQTYPQPRSE